MSKKDRGKRDTSKAGRAAPRPARASGTGAPGASGDDAARKTPAAPTVAAPTQEPMRPEPSPPAPAHEADAEEHGAGGVDPSEAATPAGLSEGRISPAATAEAGENGARTNGARPKRARAARPPAASAPGPQNDEALDSDAPPTRRSSPLPPAGLASDVRIPPLPRVDVAEAFPRRDEDAGPRTELIAGDDLDAEEAADVAPVGPTEYAGEMGSPPSSPTPAASVPAPSVEELEHQIHELEARLDRMIRQRGASAPASSPGGRSPTTSAPPASNERASRPQAPAPEDSAGVIETARELLSTDYYLRQWGKLGLRNRSEEVDEFGLDPKYEERWRPLFDFLHRVYFRVDTEGTHHIPDEGRCLIVSNHSGGPLPYDGVMLRTTVRREHAKQRELRWLAEDFIYYLPFVGAVMNRIGAVRACQENAERLLAGGKAVAVFPEGAKGIGKLYKDRYKLQRFGRGGFIRLCLRTQTPIVPCAIVGAEEANPMLYRVEYMTKALGIPYLPVTPTFPALGPLGLLPAPTKWKVRFGERIDFSGYGPEAADDEILVGRLAERVRGTIQAMLDAAVSERQSIWFG